MLHLLFIEVKLIVRKRKVFG